MAPNVKNKTYRKYGKTMRHVLLKHLEHPAELFGEQDRYHLAGPMGHVDLDPAHASEAHLQETDHEASVAYVMAGTDGAVFDELLSGDESVLEGFGALDVRRFPAQLAVALEVGRAAQATPSG